MKNHRWAVGFTAVLLGFTVYISLDTFVLSSVYQTNVTEMNLALFEGEKNTGEEAKTNPEQKNAGVNSNEGNNTQKEASGQKNLQEEVVQEEDGNISGNENVKNKTAQEETDSSKGSTGKKDRREKGKSTSAKQADNSGLAKTEDGGTDSEPDGTMKNTDSIINGNAAEEIQIENFSAAEGNNGYSDSNINIDLVEYTVNGTEVYVADVRLSSAQYLKTAFANDTYGKNVTAKTSVIATAHDAILAINGDYYGAQEKGYVIRNGVVYRDKAGALDVLCIYADGSMEIVDPSTVTAQELVDRGVWQAFSFGPALVEDGETVVAEDAEVGKAMASNPRTAIGIIDDLHYVFVVSDGRTQESEGLSLYELAEFLKELGATTAYNLDGGGSSTMVFQGNLVNHPTTTGNSVKERSVSDIVYIG